MAALCARVQLLLRVLRACVLIAHRPSGLATAVVTNFQSLPVALLSACVALQSHSAAALSLLATLHSRLATISPARSIPRVAFLSAALSFAAPLTMFYTIFAPQSHPLFAHTLNFLVSNYIYSQAFQETLPTMF